MKKLYLFFIQILIIGFFINCPIINAAYNSSQKDVRDINGEKILFLSSNKSNSNNKLDEASNSNNKPNFDNSCIIPSTTPSTAGGIFSQHQEISFSSSCKYYKTYYEINGNMGGSIGSGTIRIPSDNLSTGALSVVKLKYWSECFSDANMTSKCPEVEEPKISDYVFDTKAPEIDVLSKKNFYINSTGNNSIATIKFQIPTIEQEKALNFEFSKEEKAISSITIINSGSVQPGITTSFPVYATSLNLGENLIKLKVYDTLKNQAEISFKVIVDDTIPDIIPNRNSGLYGKELNIELLNNISESFVGTICYTTDGTDPEINPFSIDSESSLCIKGEKYTNKIFIGKTTTIKYIARELSGNYMSVRTYNYEINPNSPTVTIQTIQRGTIQGTEKIDLRFNSDKKGKYSVQITDGTGETKKDPITGEEKFFFNTKEIANGEIDATEDQTQATSLSISGTDLKNGQNIVLVAVTETKLVETTTGEVEQKEFSGVAQSNIYRDDTPPISSIQPGTSETIYNQPFISKITTEDEAISYYSINGGSELVYDTNLGIAITETSIVKYYSIDKVGNKETEKTVTYTLDLVPPEIVIADIKPLDKRLSTSIVSLSKELEFSIKSNEDGKFFIVQGKCEDGNQLIPSTSIQSGWKLTPPPFSAELFSEGLSSITICVYDKANNLTSKSITNVFRDEKGNFMEVVDNAGKSFTNFRAWEMPGDLPASTSGNKILILTQGIVWGFESELKISVPYNCRNQGSPPVHVCDYKQEKVPEQLIAQFAVPTDINEIAVSNKSNYTKIIYLAYPLGQRIEDRATTIEQIYLKTRLSANQLNASKIDWVGLSEGTLVNLELINKFSTISDKRIFIAAPFKGSIYREALAEGMIGKELWAQYGSIIKKNAPEVDQLLESSDYSKTRAPQLLNTLLLPEHKNKSFIIPVNYKNIGIDLVVSVDSQMAGTPSLFNPSNIAVVAGSHFEMGKSPTKESIRIVVDSILKTGKVPTEINGDLVKNNVPVNYINGKWIAPIGGVGDQGTFTLEPNNGKIEMKILYDNADWKVDSTILVDSNTYKNGFINTTANLNILKKDTNLTINGPATLEIVFDKEKFKKTASYINRPADFKEYSIYFSKSPFTVFMLPTSQLPVEVFGNDTRNRNTPLNINYFRLGFEDKINFRLNSNVAFHWWSRDSNWYGFCWDWGWFGKGCIGFWQHIDRTMDLNGNMNFSYRNGKPELFASLGLNSWGLLIDPIDFSIWSNKISETNQYVKYRINNNVKGRCLVDIPFVVTLCEGHQSVLFFNWYHTIDIPIPEFTLPILDKNGEPIK